MARLRERQTGAVVNVPDEKVAQVTALGHYELIDKPSKSAQPAKTASRSKK